LKNDRNLKVQDNPLLKLFTFGSSLNLFARADSCEKNSHGVVSKHTQPTNYE